MAGSGDGDGGAAGANVLVIKGQPRQTLGSSDILRQLFAQRALPHATTRWTVLRSDRRSGTLFLLQDSGVVDSIDSLVTPGVAASWQLTVSGLRSVLMCGRLGQFSPLCDVRLGIPLQGRTAYELQLMLRDGGWTWHRLPGPRTIARRQLAQAYSVGGPLRWFTRPSGQSFAVAREYLLCLLDAEVLQRGHGIDEIPNGLPQNTYALLLQGIPLAQHPPAPLTAASVCAWSQTATTTMTTRRRHGQWSQRRMQLRRSRRSNFAYTCTYTYIWPLTLPLSLIVIHLLVWRW